MHTAANPQAGKHILNYWLVTGSCWKAMIPSWSKTFSRVKSAETQDHSKERDIFKDIIWYVFMLSYLFLLDRSTSVTGLKSPQECPWLASECTERKWTSCCCFAIALPHSSSGILCSKKQVHHQRATSYQHNFYQQSNCDTFPSVTELSFLAQRLADMFPSLRNPTGLLLPVGNASS